MSDFPFPPVTVAEVNAAYKTILPTVPAPLWVRRLRVLIKGVFA